MPSDVMDAATPSAVDPGVAELLVLWQHPETREIVPIGRLSHDQHGYTYRYTRTAATIQGFRPLPGLGTLEDGVRSATMPAIFRMRVMDAERPDFANYIASLGLNPTTATPWEQIVRSGGNRAGDTLQFMELPVASAGRARARFLTSGVRHVPDHPLHLSTGTVTVSRSEHEAALESLRPGAIVDFVRQMENPHDANATLVTLTGPAGTPLGWVPQSLTASIRELLEAAPIHARVLRVNGPESPSHLRLVLDLDVPAPDGFQFDREGRWE
jgi:hypothetical protein